MRFTITTFGSAEYLSRIGLSPGGELVFHEITPRKPPMIAHIQQAVAAHFFISQDEMRSASRAREVSRPRQVAMYLARELTLRSLPEIGRLFGNRDHSTVIHACKQIEKLCETDQGLKTNVETLRAELGRPS